MLARCSWNCLISGGGGGAGIESPPPIGAGGTLEGFGFMVNGRGILKLFYGGGRLFDICKGRFKVLGF